MLALQGGGALGAFTWGVLDALLEARMEIEAISGASAGAVNGVLLASGLAKGGPEEARALLARFWDRVSRLSMPAWLTDHWLIAGALRGSLDILSPAQLNPLGFDPLRSILTDLVDFERLRTRSPIKLHISATRVKDGSARIFTAPEITIEAVLASACLPRLSESVEIDGEYFWDGGFSANPPLRELVWSSRSRRMIVVELLAEAINDPPTAAGDISQRTLELAFMTSYRRELEALEALIERCRKTFSGFSKVTRRLRSLQIHRISIADHLEPQDLGRPHDASLHRILRLKEEGQSAARAWLNK